MAVPKRKSEDDAKMDGERLKGEVTMMDMDYKEELETEERKTCRRSDSLRDAPGGDGETSAQRKLPEAD